MYITIKLFSAINPFCITQKTVLRTEKFKFKKITHTFLEVMLASTGTLYHRFRSRLKGKRLKKCCRHKSKWSGKNLIYYNSYRRTLLFY